MEEILENKRQFNKEMEKLISDFEAKGRKPMLLLHSCCGPCSSAVLERLAEHFTIKLFFYNPNIHPKDEYEKRLDAQKDVLQKLGYAEKVQLIEGEYDTESFFKTVRGFENEPEGGLRCQLCIKQRMEKTAAMAKEYNAEFFATTLTVSPHKDAIFINRAGEELETDSGISYLVSDFKKKNGYKRSTELCRLYDIYRQNYCGCIFSIRNEQ